MKTDYGINRVSKQADVIEKQIAERNEEYRLVNATVQKLKEEKDSLVSKMTAVKLAIDEYENEVKNNIDEEQWQAFYARGSYLKAQKDLDESQKKLQTMMNEYQSRLNSLEEREEELTRQINTLEEKKDKKKSELNKVNQNLKQVLSSIENENKNLDRLNLEMSDISEVKEKTKKDYEDMERLMSEKQALLDSREKSLKTYARRIKKYYREAGWGHLIIE